MIKIAASKREFLSKLMLKLDDMINPIVVKEVRQSVSSNGLVVTTILVLLLEVCAFLFNLFFQDFNFGMGNSFFILILGIFVGGYSLGIGGSVAVRMMKEHGDLNSTDLIYTTTVNPYRIVWGKLFSAMVMVSYLFSLCLPFMCISYFLKGINLSTIIFSSAFAFILAIPFMLSIIFITAVPMSKLLKIFLLIGMLIAMGFVVTMISSQMAFLGLVGGGRYSVGPAEQVGILISILYWLMALSCLLYFLTVGLLSHLTSNRTVGLKIYYVVVLFTTGLLVILLNTFFTKANIPVAAYYAASMVFLCVILVFNSFERIEQTQRVLASVPKTFLLRIWHFLFSTGMANNIFFTLILFFILNIVCLLLDYIIPNSYYGDSLKHNDYIFVKRFIGVFCYLFSYQLFGVFVKWTTKKYFEKASVFAYVLLITMLSFLLPIIVGIVLADFDIEKLGRQSEYIYIINPLIFDKDTFVNAGFIAGISFVIVGLFLNSHFLLKSLLQGLSYHKREIGVEK